MSETEAQQLRRQLEEAKAEAARERSRAANYAEGVKILKEQKLSMHSKVEQEEEFMTNKLISRLEKMSAEKKELILQVEQEEEFLTNSLQKRLDQLSREKAELETKLTTEQEYVAVELRKKLEGLSEEKSRLHREKVELERQLEAEQEYIINKLGKQLGSLTKEKKVLKTERGELRRQVDHLAAEKVRLHQDKIRLENQMEAEEECIVNRLQGQIQDLVMQKRALERRLEAGSKTSESETSEDEGSLYGSRERRLYGSIGSGRRLSSGGWQHSGGMDFFGGKLPGSGRGTPRSMTPRTDRSESLSPRSRPTSTGSGVTISRHAPSGA